MIMPIATYRLQLRNGMTFARAAELAPYLADLGVSHLYLSPIFEAVRGSTHGYDVVDNSLLAVELGGEAGFRALCAALHRHDIGVIVDFVPNHMAAHPQNSWWREVLEWGAEARHARHFDIDWSAPKLIIPVLASSYGMALERQEYGLAFDGAEGALSFTHGKVALPLTPPSYADILGRAQGSGLAELAQRFARATPETTSQLKAQLSATAQLPEVAAALVDAMDMVSTDLTLLHALHERQPWRLTHWRAARDMLTHRRFFEITDLVGITVEWPDVFADVHARVIGLVRDGSIDGLRLDHIDGLADPKAYLMRLRAAVGGEPSYILVEKILGLGENLREEWPVAGTTGYEFIRALAGLLVDQRAVGAFTAAYHRFIGRTVDYGALMTDLKHRTLTHNLAAELRILGDLARVLAERHPATRDFGADTLRRSIVALASTLPVYRTYVDAMGAGETDRALLADAAQAARETREVEDDTAIEFVCRMVAADFQSREDRAAALAFATRFQQTTGALMAKAVEDTAFYQYGRFLALNEVGGDPGGFGSGVEAFHHAMLERRRCQPAGLSATATHDTKRGEDARTRLYVLSEMPDSWTAAVERWKAQNAPLKHCARGAPVPDAEVEWSFYQALAGAWPQHAVSGKAYPGRDFAGRMVAFALKAAREAKVHTSWTAPDETYEATLEQFVRNVLDPHIAPKFLNDFADFCRPVFAAGALGSLAQILIKIAAPGVPDVYQGTELWDLSLVDPDNRRPVDFGHLANLPAASVVSVRDLMCDWRSGLIKRHVLRSGLRARAQKAALFGDGEYHPLEVAGERSHHVVAFARTLGRDAAVAVVPRLTLRLLEGVDMPMVPPQQWRDTTVVLPRPIADRRWIDACTGEIIDAKAQVALGDLVHICPVSLMISMRDGQ